MGSTKFKLTCPADLSYASYQTQLLGFYRNNFKSVMMHQNKQMTAYLRKQNMEMFIPWHCSNCNRYGARVHHYRNWHLNGKCQTTGKLDETLQLEKKLAFINYGIIHNLFWDGVQAIWKRLQPVVANIIQALT